MASKARGSGITIKNKYKWCRQPNGKITIFSVPIFMPFSRTVSYFDQSSGQIKQKLQSAGEEELQQAINNIKSEAARGHFVSIHKGHQENNSAANAPGIGYVDNTYIANGVIFADFSEIDSATFELIKNLKLPYRSVEYNPNEKRITGVALLESQDPYFKFPILAVEDRPVEPTTDEIAQFENRNRILFRRKKLAWLKFQKDNEMPQGSAPPSGAPVDESDGEEYQLQDEPGAGMITKEDCMRLEGKVDKLAESVGSLVSMMQELMSLEENEQEQGGEEPEGIEEPSGEEPESVAMCSDGSKSQFGSISKSLQLIAGNMDKLNSRMDAIEGASQKLNFNQRLKSMCEVNPNIDFASVSAQLEKFDTAQSKEQFLQFVSVQNTGYAPSRANAMLYQLSSVKGQQSLLAKFSGESPSVQAVARKALTDYRDTVQKSSESYAMQFQKKWGSEEDYVTHMVSLEKESPGNYNEIMG